MSTWDARPAAPASRTTVSIAAATAVLVVVAGSEFAAAQWLRMPLVADVPLALVLLGLSGLIAFVAYLVTEVTPPSHQPHDQGRSMPTSSGPGRPRGLAGEPTTPIVNPPRKT